MSTRAGSVVSRTGTQTLFNDALISTHRNLDQLPLACRMSFGLGPTPMFLVRASGGATNRNRSCPAIVLRGGVTAAAGVSREGARLCHCGAVRGCSILRLARRLDAETVPWLLAGNATIGPSEIAGAEPMGRELGGIESGHFGALLDDVIHRLWIKRPLRNIRPSDRLP